MNRNGNLGFVDLSNLSGPAGMDQNEVWMQWVRDGARTVDHSLKSQVMGGELKLDLGRREGFLLSY